MHTLPASHFSRGMDGVAGEEHSRALSLEGTLVPPRIPIFLVLPSLNYLVTHHRISYSPHAHSSLPMVIPLDSNGSPFSSSLSPSIPLRTPRTRSLLLSCIQACCAIRNFFLFLLYHPSLFSSLSLYIRHIGVSCLLYTHM